LNCAALVHTPDWQGDQFAAQIAAEVKVRTGFPSPGWSKLVHTQLDDPFGHESLT
jgi:hypothetical protein